MRRLTSFPASSSNSLREWYKVKNPLVVAFNFIVITSAKYSPSLYLKRILYRLVGMRIGKNSSIAAGVMMDFFFPELIEIGEDSIIGYGSLILAHEFLVKEYRIGKVRIGKRVLVGANTTILPGVEVGDDAKISAMSLVNKDVKEKSFVGGIPIKEIKN